MTVDAVIAAWVPWSTGETARYGTKLAAAADLRRRLREAGFVIVRQEPTDAVMNAFRSASTQEWRDAVAMADDGT